MAGERGVVSCGRLLRKSQVTGHKSQAGKESDK